MISRGRVQFSRGLHPFRSFATNTALPPKAGYDQIFNEAKVRIGTSLATEADWEATLEGRDTVNDIQVEEDDAALFASNRIGQVSFPPALTVAVNKLLKPSHTPSVKSAALRFYEHYTLKNEGKRSDFIMPCAKDFTEVEADAYVTGFMPQLYGSVHVVLTELRKRLGSDWLPKSVLDCGLGPGTAGLAFQDIFIESNPEPLKELPQITIIQEGHAMRERATRLWADLGFKSRKGIKIYHTLGSSSPQYDVILAPHVLEDVKGRPTERLDIVRNLWGLLAPGGVILFLERGVPMGFEHVAAARQQILRKHAFSDDPEQAAHVIAPCPHDGQCPLFITGHDPKRTEWCHFSQRLQRPDFLQRLKGARENIEDATYAYCLIRKAPRPQIPFRHPPLKTSEGVEDREALSDVDIVSSSYTWSRIIKPPFKRHKHVLLDICSHPEQTLRPGPAKRVTKHRSKQRVQEIQQRLQDEARREESETVLSEEALKEPMKWANKPGPILQRATIPKSQGKQEYLFARRSHWGDLLPFRGKAVMNKTTILPSAASKRGRVKAAKEEQD